MRLQDVRGQQFALSIIGYQCVDATDVHDRNWLVVEGQVHDRIGRWGFRDPCLDVREASELAAWLASTCNPSWSPIPLVFLEPNLYFERCELSDNVVAIRVGFDLEARPPWDTESGDEPYMVDFVCAHRTVLAASEAFREESTAFPWRPAIAPRR